MVKDTFKTLAIGSLLVAQPVVHALGQKESTGTMWSFGLEGGYHTTSMKFTNLDESYFPTRKRLGSGVFSVFVQAELGKRQQFAIRPQLSWLNRGGKLTEIARPYAKGISDINYRLKAHYMDLRLPLIYNFRPHGAKLRPYVFISPVLGFVTGGKINMQQDMADHSYSGYELKVSDANMASTYLAGQLGAGLKFGVPVAGETCYLGIEALYEKGFSNTYSKKEKDGAANDVTHLFSKNYQIEGKRKFSGFEVQLTLTVPFNVFKYREAPRPVAPIVIEPKVEEKKAVVEEPKPCYTIEEITDLMEHGKSVVGKTICAIDAINFDFGISTIKPESYPYLDNLADVLKRTNANILVKGHTDNVGTDEFNLKLSKSRAIVVVGYLIKKGVAPDKLSYEYYGSTRPLTSNETEEGRTLNRRVEFEIQ